MAETKTSNAQLGVDRTRPGSGKAGSKHTLIAMEENCFCTVKLGKTDIRVILYFPESNPLAHLLLRTCRSDFPCSLFHSQEDLGSFLEQLQHHAIVVVDAHLHHEIAELTEFIYSHNLYYAVTLVAVVSRVANSRSSESLMKDLLASGFSRVLTSEDCQERFLWELRLLERSEIRLKQQLVFSGALFEAVDQSNDAVQITGPDGKIIYVNRSFMDMSGFNREEAIGNPAMDILRCFDQKWDNGPKGAFAKKEQRWDGECMGRRKSGSVLRQHLKLIPVKIGQEHVSYHVTIQRLLHQDSEHQKITSPKSGDFSHAPVRKGYSMGMIPRVAAKLETPISKAVATLSMARDSQDCPAHVRESLEKAMDILGSSELYTPISNSGRPEDPRTRGIVSGLLTTGRVPLTIIDENEMRVLHPHHPHLRHTPITPPPQQVQESLRDIDTWQFDIISVEETSGHEPLYYVGMRIFKEFDLCEILDVDDTVLASWLKLMESHYHRERTYHNSTHAADVLQATAYMVKILQDQLVSQGEMLEHIEVAALLISSVIHDLDHPGRTNPFLCNSGHELALLYNDKAVLENHHVALSFKLTHENQPANIFQSLDSPTYRTLRTSIVDLVLATDMAKHFEHLAKFNAMKARMGEDGGSTTNLTASKESLENRVVMKKILVKCADISNPCRPVELCKVWASRIAEEYFSQTEEEKKLGLPVVFPDFDRQTCNLPVTQVKFIDFFISGLFEAWNGYCAIPMLMDNLNSNYDYWKSQYKSPESSEEDEADATS